MLVQETSFPEEKLCAPKVVLIAEDDASIAEFLSLAISQETPYTPLIATSGPHALELVQNVRPHLLILDYRLGTMNGLELYDQLHALLGFDHIPALIMGASLEKHQQEIEHRHLIGIDKPLELDVFLATVHELLALQPSPMME